MYVTTMKGKSLEVEAPVEGVEISPHQQHERVINLCLLISLLLSVNAVGLLVQGIFSIWFHNELPVKQHLVLNSTEVQGMPIPYVAVYGDLGLIEDFSIYGPTLNIFPKLPHSREVYGPGDHLLDTNSYYKIFAASHQSQIHFLSCNPQSLVTIFNVEENEYKTIANSYIPNHHLQSKVVGVQVGNYFWIYGGTIDPQSMYTNEYQMSSSIWVLPKNQWIQGPELPEILKEAFNECVVALNDSTVLIVSQGSKFAYFNFHSSQWSIQDIPFNECYMSQKPYTCTSLLDKNYHRQLFFLVGQVNQCWIQWDLATNQLKQNTVLFPSVELSHLWNQWTEWRSYLVHATFTVINGQIYLIDGYNEGLGDLQPVYKVLETGLVVKAETCTIPFEEEYENPSIKMDVISYTFYPKAMLFYKRFLT